MTDEPQKAYAAYQQALYHLPFEKVCALIVLDCKYSDVTPAARPKALVRHRDTL